MITTLSSYQVLIVAISPLSMDEIINHISGYQPKWVFTKFCVSVLCVQYVFPCHPHNIIEENIFFVSLLVVERIINDISDYQPWCSFSKYCASVQISSICFFLPSPSVWLHFSILLSSEYLCCHSDVHEGIIRDISEC